MNDDIIHEVWHAKDELARRFNYNVEDLADELRRRQKESKRTIVNLEKEARERAGTSSR